MDVLMRIKWAVLTGRYRFTNKARIEMKIDDLTELDVAESILNAREIYKKLDQPVLHETNDANTFT